MSRYQFTDVGRRDYPALGLYNVGTNDVADLASAPDYRWVLVDPSTSVTVAPPSSFIAATIPSMPSNGNVAVWSTSVGGPIFRALTPSDISGVVTSTSLTPTIVQTSNSTAAAGDLRPFDISGGSRVLTLPTAPADKSLVMTTIVAIAGSNTLTVNAGGSAVFTVAGGATTYVMSQLNQSATFQYSASTSVWYVIDSSFSLTALNAANAALYAPIGTVKQTVLWTGDTLFLGYDADVNGTDMVAPATITQLLVELDKPPVGDAVVFTFYRYTPSTNTELALGTVTIAAGAVAGVSTISQAVLTDDKITIRVTSVGASTYPGAGPKARLALGGSFPASTAPGVPSGLTAIPGTASGINLIWTPGSNSSSTLIYRDGQPYVNAGPAASYTDFGPTGSGMTTGETHSYDIAARRYAALSALTGSPITATPTVEFVTLPQADGSLTNPNWLTTSGTGASSAVASNVLTLASGTAGNNVAADRELLLFTGDTGLRSAWEVRGLFAPITTGSIFEHYVSSNTFNLSGSFTAGVQFQLSTAGYRVGYKSTTWNPSGVGTGSTGSFQNLTDSGYTTNLSTTRTAGGVNLFSSVLTLSTYYGYRVVASLVDGTGQQLLYLYFGTAAQYGTNGSGLPLLCTVTLLPAMRSALPTGSVLTQQLGHQANTSGTSESTKWQKLSVIPLSASGS